MEKALKSMAAAAALAVLVLSGCSDPGTGAGATEPVVWPAQDANLEGVALTLWAAQSSTDTAESVISAFEETTGAKINVVTIPDPYEQSVQTKVATGDKPDMAFWQPTASQLTALNAATNLQPLDGAEWVENYNGGLGDLSGILDDTRYAALVTSPAVQGVYYNKEVFAAAGIDGEPASFDELLQTARSLKQKGTTPFYEMGDPGWSTQWWVQVQLADAAADGLWDRVNSNEEKFTDPTIQNAVETYKDLIDEGLFNQDIKTATFEDQGEALLNGEAAMVMQTNPFFSQLQAKASTEELDEKIGFFPISPEGNIGTFIPDQSNALVAFKTGDEQRQAAARQFLSFWLGDGYPAFVEEQSTVSLLAGTESPGTVPDALSDVASALDSSVGSMQAQAVANPDLWINLANMIQGTMTPQEVTSTTQSQFEKLAKAQGVPGF